MISTINKFKEMNLKLRNTAASDGGGGGSIEFYIDDGKLDTFISDMESEREAMSKSISGMFKVLGDLPQRGAWSGEAFSTFWSEILPYKKRFYDYLHLVDVFIARFKSIGESLDASNLLPGIYGLASGDYQYDEVKITIDDPSVAEDYTEEEETADANIGVIAKNTELYNSTELLKAITDVSEYFDDFAAANKSLNDLVSRNIGSLSGAIFGDAATAAKTSFSVNISAITDLKSGLEIIKSNIIMANNYAQDADNETQNEFKDIIAVLDTSKLDLETNNNDKKV